MKTQPRDIYRNADFTPQEQEHVRVALMFLRHRIGSWEKLGAILRFTPPTLIHVCAKRRTVSPTMAVRVARAAQWSIDGLLAGEYPGKEMCRHCGHKHDGSEARPIL